jgi:uncharacterized protein (DUF952 family)
MPSWVAGDESKMQQTRKESVPQHLYKIISTEDWKRSQPQNNVELSSKDDEVFIHLSTEDQLDRIIKKYWSENPEYVVLKIDVSQLNGQLVYEANPGGTNKYYHLYKGTIPLKGVVEAKIIKSNE